MRELYGILGYADVPEEVVQGSLNDIRTSVDFLIPWYGIKPIPTALVAVYDWMIDNGASYEVIASTDGTPCPKALREGASKVEEVEDPSKEIIERLVSADPAGFALIMWDESDPEGSMALAIDCIQEEIPSLELTAGLAPIILDEDSFEIGVVFDGPEIPLSDLPEVDPMEWDEETLEFMPAASVKRMAREAGHTVKTKAEAIKAIKGTTTKPQKEESIGKIDITLLDGSELSFSLTQKLLKEILDLVAGVQK